MIFIWAAVAAVTGALLGTLPALQVQQVTRITPWWKIGWLPAVVAASFAALAVTRAGWWALPAGLTFAVLGWWAAAIDAYTAHIPDRLLVITAFAVTTLALIPAIQHQTTKDFLVGLACGAGAGLLVWLVHLITRGGIGFGDVKFAALTGTVVAYASPHLVAWHLLGALVCAVVAIWPSRQPKGPLGPWLVVASIIAITLN